jgi:Glycosyltransferase family 17
VRRVFDGFMFGGELDLLECRLTELDSAVYRFVITEAPLTHQGNPKPLHFLENRERFSAWQDKIIYVRADISHCHTTEERENTQRENIRRGLGEMRDDDIFLLSDLDEIPRADVLQEAPGHSLLMRNHVLAVNLMDANWWDGTVATDGPPRGSLQKLRDGRRLPAPAETKWLLNPGGFPAVAGWHFSWLGGPDAMRAKVHAFLHPQMAPLVDQHAERLWKEKVSLATGNLLVETVIDETWPKYMQDRKGPASWYWPGHAV